MIDFPASPTENQMFQAPGGPRYVYSNGGWRMSDPGPPGTAQTRNRIVNGAMQVSQEWGNSLLGPGSALATYAADQWQGVSSTSPGTAQQQRVQVVTPNGSQNRVRVTVGTAKAALAAGDYLALYQPVEGIRAADFRYGSASARQAVLRFGWKSPAGTYSVNITNSAINRSYVASFTIAAGAANTDTEQVTVIPGDTAGTWLADTGIGFTLRFNIAAGTTFQGAAGWQAGQIFGTSTNTNGMATAGAVYELFDVGLYLDPLATGVAPRWEMPDEAQELAACQRYFQSYNALIIAEAYGAAGGSGFVAFALSQVMRIAPALAFSGVTYNNASGLVAWAVNPSKYGAVCTVSASASYNCVHNATLNARM